MKIKIGNYKSYIGPYQIAEKLLFFIPKYDEVTYDNTKAYIKYVRGLGELLSKTWLLNFCQWLETKRKQKVKIKIDYWDTWNADYTLALIILPVLKQLRDTQHGSAQVDSEDVPESMQLVDYDRYDYQQCFDFYHEPDLQKIQCTIHDQWAWVLDEMIWAFEQIADENSDDQFHVDGFDVEAYREHRKRIQNGLRLFGKYYQGLWD